MKISFPGFVALTVLSLPAGNAFAAPKAIVEGLRPHRASYDIDMIATHSGSQVVNISGKMTYEWHKTCDAWITNHEFTLIYAYADGPGMKIESDFSTYENMDGSAMQFASRRVRDGKPYQEIRGAAQTGKDGGSAVYSAPEGLLHSLKPGTLFPVGHTIALVEQAKKGVRFYPAVIFDGSDEEGPIEINSFIGSKAKATVTQSEKINAALLKGPAWNVRMAVFNDAQKEEESDYEMDMVFHENGVISGMTIDYDDFSVKQNLVSLEELPADSCVSAASSPTKP